MNISEDTLLLLAILAAVIYFKVFKGKTTVSKVNSGLFSNAPTTAKEYIFQRYVNIQDV